MRINFLGMFGLMAFVFVIDYANHWSVQNGTCSADEVKTSFYRTYRFERLYGDAYEESKGYISTHNLLGNDSTSPCHNTVGDIVLKPGHVTPWKSAITSSVVVTSFLFFSTVVFAPIFFVPDEAVVIQ